MTAFYHRVWLLQYDYCGVYENSAPSSGFTVIGGSGKDDLAGLIVAGKYFARDDKMVIDLEYTFANGR